MEKIYTPSYPFILKPFRVCIFLFLLIAFSFSANAQRYGWAKMFNPIHTFNTNYIANAENSAMARDAAGNFYLTGILVDTIDFDPGPGVFLMNSAIVTLKNQHITKLSPEGDFIWAKNIGGGITPDPNQNGANYVTVNDIAVANDGSVYTIGFFSGKIDFDPGPGTDYFMATFAKPGAVYLNKLNADGSYAWTKIFEGWGSTVSNQDNGMSVTVDNANNVYPTVVYHKFMDIDPGPGTIILQNSNSNGSQTAVVKLDPNGNYLTHYVWSESNVEEIRRIIIKNGFIYVNVWASVCNSVRKLDLNFNLIWEKRTQNLGSGVCSPYSISVDDAGNVITAGSFNNLVDFDPGPAQALRSPSASYDHFVCKWDRNGKYQWVTTFTQGYFDINVASDRNGDIYYDYYEQNFNSGYDHIITKLNYKADYQWSGYMHCTNIIASRDLIADDNGNIYTCGTFANTADFDPDPNTTQYLTTTLNVAAPFISKISNSNHIMGKVFLDWNNNGVQDAGDDPMPWRWVDAQSSSQTSYGHSTLDGTYDIYTDSGNYNITVPYPPPYYTSSAVNTASFPTGVGGIDSVNNFPIVPIPNINDLSVNFWPHSALRPGFAFWGTVVYRNTGTTTLSGSVTLKHSPLLTYLSASPAPASYANQMFTWNYTNLKPFEIRYLDVYFATSSSMPLGSTIYNVSTVYPIVNDTTPLNNKDSAKAVATGSFDPNDKTVLPSGGISKSFICADSSVNYVIRFQNTGTDTAFIVVVTDTIQNNLNINSLEILGASHPFATRVDEGRTIKFIFKNIMLPDSNHNEPKSHGFIAYKIKPLNNLAVGASIKNMASIYFDFNTAVTTNQTNNTVTPLQAPTISISSSTTTACLGTPITFTATAGYPGTTPVYQWQVNGSNVGTNSPTFTSSTLNTGDQVVCLLNSNASCVTASSATSNTITVTISSSVTPTVGISTASSSVCSGTSVVFTAAPVNEGPAPVYQWQVNGINAGTNSNTFTTVSLNNNDQVKVILTSSFSCASPATATSNVIIMTITPSPVGNAGNDTTICTGTSAQLNGSGGTTYLWSPATGLSNPNIANPVATPAATTKYFLTIFNGGTCSSVDSVVVTVGQALTATVNITASATNICPGSPVTFTAASTNGGPSPVYNWQVNGIIAGTNSNIFTSSTLNNNDKVKVILTSSLGCAINANATSNVITVSIRQVGGPTITLKNGVFTVTSPDPTASYTWQKLINNIWTDLSPVATGITLITTSAGEYRAKTAKGNCIYYSNSIVANYAAVETGISLHPVPASRSITIDSIPLSQKWETIEITNVETKRVLQIFNIKSQTSISIDISTLSSGTYLAIFRKQDGTLTTIKFVKQ